MSGSMDGKVVVITGAGSGMGLTASKLFHAEGAKLVLADVSGKERKAADALRKKLASLSLLILAAASSGIPASAIAAPDKDLRFITGMQNPEDLAELPGKRWIVASGMAPNSGLHLIDANAKTATRWIAPADAHAIAPFDRCPSQPSADELQVHGISVRDHRNGHLTLYAVNHGGKGAITQMNEGRGREAIEVFDIDMTGESPALTWQGCVPMPDKLVANSVISGSDGAIYATVMLHPGNAMDDLWKGVATGAVYKWTPGTAGFQRMAGTERTANNGIEISRDGKVLYVVSLREVTSFTNSSPAVRLKTTPLRNGLGDNIHWAGNRLIVAGARTDLCVPEPNGAAYKAGYYVSRVDPVTLAITPLAKGEKNPAFAGVSVGLPVGNTLWLGSYSADRVAYRALP